MKRKVRALAVALTLALGIVAVAGSPALAVGDSAPTNAFAIWTNSNWSGTPQYYWTTPSNGCHNIAGALNDETNSAKLGASVGPTSAYAILYEHSNCTGAVIASAVNTNTSTRLLDCHATYNSWNTFISGCTWGDVSSFWYHD